jgi:hypothetical protein
MRALNASAGVALVSTVRLATEAVKAEVGHGFRALSNRAFGAGVESERDGKHDFGFAVVETYGREFRRGRETCAERGC